MTRLVSDHKNRKPWSLNRWLPLVCACCHFLLQLGKLLAATASEEQRQCV